MVEYRSVNSVSGGTEKAHVDNSGKRLDENELRCIIKNVALFKSCLESVKYPTSVKNKYNVSQIFQEAQAFNILL